MRSVLVIDDNPAVGTALDLLFGLRDIRTLTATTPQEGLEVLARERVDLVVQDMNFSADTTSGEEGVALYRAIRAEHADLPIILLTAWTRLETAVELVKAGAGDYLGKPWDDHKLLATVENLLERSEATREVARFARSVAGAGAARCRSRPAASCSSAAPSAWSNWRSARADVPVLITGPNGAGKERIAEIVQPTRRGRRRRSSPSTAVPAGADRGRTVGAEPGAATAPNRAREGRFEVADGGTLFLDDGNLPLAGQMKLLRVPDRPVERPVRRTRQADVRVISATNADLAAAIRDGRFREDLYYRLNVIELRLPPLSERSDDILPLAEHFLQGRATLDAGARAALAAHAWPGNVRELENAIERAGLLCSNGVVGARDLGLAGTRASAGRLPADAEPDRETIEGAIRRARGVISQAAAELGLSRQALYRRLQKLGIEIGD